MLALTVFAALVAIGCAAACTARLYFATNPIALHPAVWLAHLQRRDDGAVSRAIASDPRAAWERELTSALAEPDPEARAGKINEQLTELDFRLGRWDRVPRVCASIASSAGFLFGSLVLRFGLSAAADTGDDGSNAINTVVLQAINVAALGVAGATFAIAAQYRSRKAAKAFQRDADALVDVLDGRRDSAGALEGKMQGHPVEE